MATTTSAPSTDGAATKKPAHGDIGRQTYEDVRKLVEQGMKKTEAFAKVAKETGRSANTVMTQYYRTAREQVDGGGVRRTVRSASKSASKSANQQTERLILEAKTAIDALQAHIADLERELERATQESRELEKIRKVLHKR